MKNILFFFWEISKIVIIALVIVVPIRYFIFQPFFVRGQSMEPNFQNGDYLIVDEISYRLRAPQRGEIVVFKYPMSPSQKYIKRIIGLPGETVGIQNGKINVYDSNGIPQILDEVNYLPEFVETFGNSEFHLSDSEYFVLGDNRLASSDSRRWGPVPKENIIGRVLIKVWPFAALAMVETPTY